MSPDLSVKKEVTTIEDFLSEDSDTNFLAEDEKDTPEQLTTVQTGWDAAKKGIANSSKYAHDFKVEEDVQLIKIISEGPMTFQQHWLTSRPGKKSFISTGPDDPLCQIGSVPSPKFAFTVLNLSDETSPQLQLLIAGVRLCGQLEKLASDKKTGPLNRPDMYYAISKSGTKTVTYSVVPVKERDLKEDWGIDPVAAAEYIKTLKPLGPEALHAPTNAELAEIANEIGEL